MRRKRAALAAAASTRDSHPLEFPTTRTLSVQQPAHLGVALHLDLSVLLGQVRSAVLSAAEERARKRRAQQEEVQFWKNTEGGHAWGQSLDAMPELLPFHDSLHVIPSKRLARMRFAPDRSQKSTAMADWASSNTRRCNLAKALRADWQRKSSLVKAPRTEEADTGADAEPPCVSHGAAAPELEAQSPDAVLQQLELAPIPSEAAGIDLPPRAEAQAGMAPPAPAAQKQPRLTQRKTIIFAHAAAIGHVKSTRKYFHFFVGFVGF